MRSRNIKPGFFKNADLAELPFETRILFEGLWCLADRKGRLVDRPKQIKGEVFPHDLVNVDTMLALLQTHAFILRYERDENKYIQIINFEKHQYPHIREQNSTIPAPCKPGASTSPAHLIPDVLIPDVLIPDSLNPAGRTLAGAFDAIWNDYPKRLGRKEAFAHFKASVKSEADVSAIRSALANYKKQIEGQDRQYIQHGSTWFNNWRDYTEINNGAHDSPSRIDLKALARSAREAKNARANASVGEVSDSLRGNALVPHENGRNTGGTNP